MHKNPPNYEKELIKEIRNNDLETIGLLESKDKGLFKKISNFSKKHGFSEKEVIKEIIKNIYFRSVFSKDPGKQNLHEKIAAKYIKSLPQVKKFEKLPTGKLAILSGALLPRKKIIEMGGNRKAKTIDFIWETKGKKIVASHKYTKEGGGAQDNQYKDLLDFISEANQSNSKDIYFLAIADGAYYDTKEMSTGTSKIEYLKRKSDKHNVFAMTIKNLEEWLNKLK